MAAVPALEARPRSYLGHSRTRKATSTRSSSGGPERAVRARPTPTNPGLLLDTTRPAVAPATHAAPHEALNRRGVCRRSAAARASTSSLRGGAHHKQRAAAATT
eukprot:scaffold87776_cov32-Tisochrysis_lutea.AAC.3